MFRVSCIQLRSNNSISQNLKKTEKLIHKAIKQKTGARGLRSIIEKLLIDLMFEAPDKKDLESIVINKDTVLQKSEPILIYSHKQQNNQKILANKS